MVPAEIEELLEIAQGAAGIKLNIKRALREIPGDSKARRFLDRAVVEYDHAKERVEHLLRTADQEATGVVSPQRKG